MERRNSTGYWEEDFLRDREDLHTDRIHNWTPQTVFCQELHLH